VSDLIESIFSLRDSSKGVGVAANQAGLDSRVISLDLKGFGKEITSPIARRLNKIKLSSDAVCHSQERK
jgi:peptide deformylase